MADFGLSRGQCNDDSQPPLWGRYDNSMKWHHVIPRSVLRNSWNTLARHQSAENSSARNAAHTWMRILGYLHEDAKKLLALMAAGQLPFEKWLTLNSDVAFPPWDIVEGPGKRSDDPGDSFDEYTVGLTDGEWWRHKGLKTLNENLNAFNIAAAGLQAPGSSIFTMLQTQFGMVERNLADVKAPIKFRPAMWEITPSPDNKELPPAQAKWRKRSR